MYEGISYELILKKMLDSIPDHIDKREGSVIYDALAPAAIELQNMYIELDVVLAETFADTASREMLLKRGAERGVFPFSATKAIVEGEFTPSTISILGKRFSLNALNYVVCKEISAGVYEVECETEGIVGNQYFGDLIPIDYIDGLETARLTKLLIPGEDEEETEAFRQRYMNSFSSQAFGGNQTDYKEKVLALPGVGAVKVYPVWNGGGTVKLVIMDTTYGLPSAKLIADVQQAIDPPTGQGEGLGLAPIGHVVTVEGVETTPINVALTLTYELGWDWQGVESYVQTAIDEYFAQLAKDWQGVDHIVVRVSQIETRVLTCPGVVDVRDSKLNGNPDNISLDGVHIPVRGVISG